MFNAFGPFAFFVVAMTGTPGPGNLTMLAIGQTTGFRSAIPFLAGTTCSFLALNTLVACGLGEAYKVWSVVPQILKLAGAAYILYLAVKILRLQAAPPEVSRRFTFFEGILIHPLSPKSWAMSVAAFSQFVGPDATGPATLVLFVVTFMVGQVLFHSLWCALGAGIYRMLQHSGIRFAVNSVLVCLMLGATFYALLV